MNLKNLKRIQYLISYTNKKGEHSMKIIVKKLSTLLILTAFFTAYPMMQEDAYNQDEIEAASYAIKKLDFIGYKNVGATDTQNKFFEKEWRENMQTIAALINAKELSNLKLLFDKVQEYADSVFNTAKTMNALRKEGSMKDKIKIFDGIKNKQSGMKRFLMGQKVKSALSLGKKAERYKKLKQLLMDIVDLLNNKIKNMEKEFQVKKK